MQVEGVDSVSINVGGTSDSKTEKSRPNLGLKPQLKHEKQREI